MNTNRERLIIDNIQFAKNVAKKKYKQNPYLSYDEIESAAFMGLVEAAKSYDRDKNDEFSAYAYLRIMGAINDYFRELRWGTRTNPVSVVEVHEEDAWREEIRHSEELFDKVVSVLTKTSRKVMRQYYVEELKIREIAALMEVNESRVSQVLTESRSRLKQAWGDYELELWAEVA